MRIHNKSQAGFTIIEIMIVVMIIGVLAAIVLPNVRSYAVRAKMSEAMLALAPCKDVVSEVYQSQSGLPDAGSWGCEGTNVSTYVSQVDTTEFGTIRVMLRGFNDGRLDSHEITLAPLDSSGNLPTGPDFTVRSWRCGSPVDGTDILPRYIPLYLPAGCRG
ncbi:MAG TPA: pilin [Burkholderiales bacterium]|jgi:type IV pilus assembly protein PilA|nr:pilin [Burkholderiales bacterium]